MIMIAVEEILAIQKRRRVINGLPLNQIIWTKNGKPITPNRKRIKDWELTGLTNIDFVTSGEYEK